jgi:hypothetical protein
MNKPSSFAKNFPGGQVNAQKCKSNTSISGILVIDSLDVTPTLGAEELNSERLDMSESF